MAKTDLIELARAIVLREPTSLATLRKDAADLVEVARLIDSAESGKMVLDQLEMFNLWCQRLNADTETINLVQRGRFETKVKVGQYLPPREKGGRGNSRPPTPVYLPKNLIADCRWLYDNHSYIETYFSELGDEEASLPRFRSYVTAYGRDGDAADTDEAVAENDDVGKRPTPERLLAVKNSPLILLGERWCRSGDSASVIMEDVSEKECWNLADRLDSRGAFAVFRTLGRPTVFERAVYLRRNWRLADVGWYVNVTGMERFGSHASESLLICTVGKPDLPERLPRLNSNAVRCPAAGVESLVYSWFADFIGARGTHNLVIEIGGTAKHKGFQSLALEELEVAV